jgi:hypothetical protein
METWSIIQEYPRVTRGDIEHAREIGVTPPLETARQNALNIGLRLRPDQTGAPERTSL